MEKNQAIINASIALATGEALGLHFWNRSPSNNKIRSYYFSNEEIEFSNGTYLYLSSLFSIKESIKLYSGNSSEILWEHICDNALLFFLSWNDDFEYLSLQNGTWEDFKKIMIHSRTKYYFDTFVSDGRGLNFDKSENNLMIFKALPFLFFDIELQYKYFRRFVYQTHRNENSVINSIELIKSLRKNEPFLKIDSAELTGFSFIECLKISQNAVASSVTLEELFINSIRPEGDNAGSVALSFFIWSLNHDDQTEMNRLASRLSKRSRKFLTQIMDSQL